MAKQESKKKQADKNEGAEVASGPRSIPKNYTPRLKTKYKKEIVTSLMKQFSFKSPMRAPYLKKIAINQGVGDAVAARSIKQKPKTVPIISTEPACREYRPKCQKPE